MYIQRIGSCKNIFVLWALKLFLVFRFEESKEMLETAVSLYKLCVSRDSNFSMFAKSVLVIVLKVLDKREEAVDLANEIISETG